MPQQTANPHPSHFVNANSFIPERWLLDGEDKYRKDKRGVTQPFLVGPRHCIGQRYVTDRKDQHILTITKSSMGADETNPSQDGLEFRYRADYEQC